MPIDMAVKRAPPAISAAERVDRARPATGVDQAVQIARRYTDRLCERAEAPEPVGYVAMVRFVVRGVVQLTDHVHEQRTPLQGTADQIRDDLGHLADQGVTEVFLDLNWDPQTVSADVDPATALGNAERVLTAFAPGPG